MCPTFADRAKGATLRGMTVLERNLIHRVDADGNLLPPGERGEIVDRSPHVVERYLDDEAATETAFRFGWFHSGDAGHLGEDGMLWFDDRYKDVIKTGGENVASIEVEKIVLELAPEIAQAVAIGLPHPHWGEAITVVAVAREGATVDPTAVLARHKTRLSSFNVPKALVLVDVLPMTSTGQVQRHVLRKEHADYFRR